MKFYEKLVVLRKKNNMSQEQLADKLGVSRQAVSKWESGSSVPDMEKMMQLCKILNCNLEELVDDGVGASSNTSKQDIFVSWKYYYQEVIDFITKTLNMFWSMRLVEKVKCLLEMFCIGFLLYFIWAILGSVVSSSFYPILSIFPDVMYRIVVTLSSFIYQIFGIIAGIVILIHIFKIRYLDYFITIEDSDITKKSVEVPIEEVEKQKEVEQEPRRFLEKKKNTIVIRDPKHSTYSFFGMLAKILVWLLKFLFILCAIPCVICFVVFAFLGSCSIWYLKDGVFFLGILLTLIGCLIINYLVLKVIYQFVLELKIPFQKIFILFMIGLFLLGFGVSISFCNYLTFEKVELNELKTTTERKEMDESLVFAFQEYYDVRFVEDNTLSDIKLEIEHSTFTEVELSTYPSYIYTDMERVSFEVLHIDLYSKRDFFEEMNSMLDRIQEKKQIDLENIYDCEVTVYASSETISKLKENYQKFYR